MEGFHENTKKPMRPLVQSTLPLFAPSSFPVSENPYSFKAVIPSSSSSNTQNSSLQHDEKYFVNCMSTDSAIKVEIETAGGCSQQDSNMDPRKLKRIISNRVSAQKSRMKKLQYVSDMERKAKALEAKIAILHPQVVMYRNKQYLLEMEQKRLSHEISTRKSKKLLKDGEIEENRAEVNRLRKLYLVQEEEKIEGHKILAADWNNLGFDHLINMDLTFNSNQGKVGENIGEEMCTEDWSEETAMEEIWNPNFEAALMEDTSSKLMGIEQILKP